MFRDDEEAAQARVDVLLRELEVLKAENQKLKVQPAGASGPGALAVNVGAAFSALLWAGVFFGVVYFLPGSTAPLIIAGQSLLMLLSMFFIRSVSITSRPGEALIVSGRRYLTPDGKEVGFRVLLPGERMLLLPIVDSTTPLSLRTMLLTGELSSVYLKGNRSARVSFSALCRVTTDKNLISNAVERFLGRTEEEVEKVARELLEGGLRGMCTTLSLDELQGDAQELSERLTEELKEDMEKLGLVLERCQLKSVTPQ